MLLKRMAETIDRYQLIQSGDRIVVGISGGKDSLGLWQLLQDQFDHDPKVTFYPVHISLSFAGGSALFRQNLIAYFTGKDHTLLVKDENYQHEFAVKSQNKNPCFVCSRIRRRVLFETAEALQCNKIALAHHKDDAIETLLLNIFYGREISTMLPKQAAFGEKFHIIRPLYEIEEKLLTIFAREQDFPKTDESCPYAGQSKRKKMKELIGNLNRENKNVKESIFQSLFHVNQEFLPTK